LENQSQQQELQDIIASRENGFGYQFKTARSAQNISIADVARELRLDQKIIIALESEDHAHLPVAAFVCGYIRNYAKFLKIQPEALIDYYKGEHKESSLSPQLKITKKQNINQPANLSRIITPIFWLLLLLLLAFGGWKLWLYVQTHYPAEQVTQSLDGMLDAPDIDTATIENAVHNNDSNRLLLPEPEAIYDVPAGEEMIEAEKPLDKTLEEKTAGSKSSTEQETGSLSADKSSLAGTTAAAEGSNSSQSTTAAAMALPEDVLSVANLNTANLPSTDNTVVEKLSSAENSQALDGTDKSDQLVVTFSGNSWVSIKDAENKILSSGLKKAGKTLLLKGKLPYQVFLGDARVVSISINGKIFDHSSYINKKNIARFRVK